MQNLLTASYFHRGNVRCRSRIATITHALIDVNGQRFEELARDICSHYLYPFDLWMRLKSPEHATSWAATSLKNYNRGSITA